MFYFKKGRVIPRYSIKGNGIDLQKLSKYFDTASKSEIEIGTKEMLTQPK